MVQLRPFAALRYAAVDSLGAVIAPPYDVISPAQQEELYARDAHNVIRLEGARGVPIACAQVRPGAAGEIATSHQLWQMTGPPAERLTELFRDKKLYIADGHHRYETALDYRDERRLALNRVDPDAPYEFVMMLLVAADDPG